MQPRFEKGGNDRRIGTIELVQPFRNDMSAHVYHDFVWFKSRWKEHERTWLGNGRLRGWHSKTLGFQLLGSEWWRVRPRIGTSKTYMQRSTGWGWACDRASHWKRKGVSRVLRKYLIWWSFQMGKWEFSESVEGAVVWGSVFTQSWWFVWQGREQSTRSVDVQYNGI